MKSLVQHIALVLLLLVGLIARTQTYPVQAFVQVSPPYNSYLPDYADPFSNQMKVLLTLTDFSIPSTQVKLRFKIEGPGYSMQSTDLIAFPIITLTPGMPVEISGSDLAPYLASENLLFSGLNFADYELSKVLPEGPASICVEVVDVTSAGQPLVGSPVCGQTWFSLYDPPLLNMPFCGTELITTDPQAVIFSWTPLHMGSPLAGLTEYIFELYEIRPETGDPNMVVESTLPIYIETTANTFMNYGIVQPILNTGMSYVWRVKARDPSGRNLYRNNGFSAVCTFTWGSIASALIDGITLELNSNGTGVRQGLTWWNASDLFDNYVLEVRKTNNPAFEWFPYNADQGELKVNSLEPETEYECRVKGIAGGAETDWSNISNFTTQPQPEYACGSTALPAVSPLDQPLEFLLPSNIVATGQFEMTITSAEPLMFPGHFRGRGKVRIPFMLTNMNVEFEDIYIDDNMTMRTGRVDVITEGIDAWLADFGDIYIPGIINPGGFEFSDDSLVTVHFGDETLEFDFKDGDPLVFHDESGLIYTVYSDGTIAISGSITWDDDKLAATADHMITFHAFASQDYGFDEKEHLPWTLHYPCIALDDGSLYFVPYKSVASGGNDIVAAIITSAETIIAPQFKYADGTLLSSIRINDSTYHVTVGNVPISKIIYAYDDLGAKIGKTFLSVYAERNHNLIVVPVNGATIPPDIQTYLNQTFAQANVTFNLSLAAEYENNSYDINTNGLESPDAALMQKYSLEMRSLRDAYFAENEKESDSYYIFVVPEFDSALDGYMVRGKAVGFIKSDEETHTYAHELAHGAFGLKHTFPTVPQTTTINLLDYTAAGNHLTHEQWYEMQHFTPVFSVFDDEEDGGYITINLDLHDLEKLYGFMNADSSLTFISLGGKPISLKGSVTKLIFSTYEDNWFKRDGEGRKTVISESVPMGCLNGFEINGIYYSAKASKNGEVFTGYNSIDAIYTESLTGNLDAYNTIAGLPSFEGGEFVFKLFLSNIFEENPVEIDSLNQGLGDILSDNAYMAYMDNATSEDAVSLFAQFGTTITDNSKGLLHHFIDYDVFGKDAMLALRTAHILGDFPIYGSCLSILDASVMQMAMHHLNDSLANLELPANFTGIIDETEVVIFEYLFDFEGIPYDLSAQTSSAYETQKTLSSYHLIRFLHGLETYNLLAEKMKDGVELSLYDVKTLIRVHKDLNTIEVSLGDCAMELLNFEARKSILNHVSEWSISDEREDLMVKVIETTPEVQYYEMLDLLAANNCELLADIWSDTWFSHLDRFIAAISQMALAVKQSEPGYSGTDLPLIPFYNDGVFWDWNETEYDWSACQIEFNHDYSLWEGEDHILHPFDLVRVDVKEDFRFPILDGNGRTLSAGQILVVPAIWAYYILDKQNDVTNLTVLRVIGDALIMLGSGGTAAPFYVYAAGVDMLVAGFENIIMSNEEYKILQTLYHTYDALALVIGGIEGLSQLKWFNKISIAGALNRYSIKSSKLKPLLLATHKQIKKRDEIIEILRTAILGMAGDILTSLNATKMRNGLMSTLISLEYNKYANSVSNAVIINAQNDFLAIELMRPIYGNHTGDILPFANVIKTDLEIVAYHLDELKWISAEATDGEYTSIVELYGVKYKNKFDEIVTGNLEVVMLENGLVRVIEILGDKAGFRKLSGKSTSLSLESRIALDEALETAPSIKYKYGSQILQTPKDFFSELGDDMYDIIFADGSYVKFDNHTGRMLYTVDGEEYFVRYPKDFKVDDVEAVMRDKYLRFRNYLGLNGPQLLVFQNGLGTASTGSGNLITVIGKMDDTQLTKDQFGYFKHYKVGENADGTNLLNMPDPYWIPATWYPDHNQDWMLRAIERGDDFYIASPIIRESLYNLKKNGDEYGSYYAHELNELILWGEKPVNISAVDWEIVRDDIIKAAATEF